jgi:hypothetical protein
MGARHTYPMPNSSQLVLPMIVAPEAVSRRTTVASKGDWKSLRGVVEFVYYRARESGASSYLGAWLKSTSSAWSWCICCP